MSEESKGSNLWDLRKWQEKQFEEMHKRKKAMTRPPFEEVQKRGEQRKKRDGEIYITFKRKERSQGLTKEEKMKLSEVQATFTSDELEKLNSAIDGTERE